jgi:capsid protein
MKNPFSSLFSRKSPNPDGRASLGPSFESLSPADQLAAARKLGSAALAIAADAHGVTSFAKGYEAVTEPFTKQRRSAYIELKGEDKQLSARDRNRIINMHRDMLRNSPARVTQNQQICVNVVGTVGGKCYLAFPEKFKDAAEKLSRLFNKQFFSRAEFTYRRDFNWILKTCLTAQDSNGAVILVFDDGILTGGNGTGRIRGFEGDEIANVPMDDLRRHFGEKATQSHGLVYDRSGIWTGAFVSSSQRGRNVFSPEQGYVKLRFDPYADDELTNWIMIGDMSRFNQGKPISQLTSAITTLVDLHETIASEAQSTKLNSKLVGQIISTAGANPLPGTERPMGFTNDAANPSVGSTAPTGELPEKTEFSLAQLQAIGSVFNQLPPDWKIELLDSKRPNPNLGQYLDLLMGLCGGPKGLARVYATMKAQTSYTAFRGEQIMTWPSFREMSKDLERNVCDWAIRNFVRRAQKTGLIDFALPDHWEDMVAWNWPKMIEVSEKEHQAALAQALRNGTTTIRRELGPGEYEKIRKERQQEVADARADGIVDPRMESTSGGIIEDDPSTTSKPSDPDEPTEET